VAELKPGPDLYEKEIEELVWANIDLFVQETLFPLRRQATLPSGGQPDLLALDKVGRVVVFEIKRDMDRRQLAQSLEYAGWARSTNLDELAALYFKGPEAFFSDWQEFTESETPITVNHSPRLVLIARDVHSRTNDALKFLRDNGLPVMVLPVTVYEDDQKRWLVEIENEIGTGSADAPLAGTFAVEPSGKQKSYMINGHQVRLGDLLEYGVLPPGSGIEFSSGAQTTVGVITAEGNVVVGDQVFGSPSAAGKAAVGHPVDGWVKWKVPSMNNKTLAELRRQLLESVQDQL
jgi:hypothetical protein